MKQNRPNRLQHNFFKKHQLPEKEKENQYREHCCRDVLISLNVKVLFLNCILSISSKTSNEESGRGCRDTKLELAFNGNIQSAQNHNLKKKFDMQFDQHRNSTSTKQE